MDQHHYKRIQNEKKFLNWVELPGGNRRYWFEIKGRSGWKARYIKEVDANENTTRFYQEIYNEKDRLVEIHEKFPTDKGHEEVKE